MKNFPAAVAWAHRALERFSDHLDSWFVLVMAYREMKEWERMKQASERYLAIYHFLETHPAAAGYMIHNTVGERWRVYLAMGEYFLEMNQPTEAESSFERGCLSAFSRPLALSQAAEAYRSRLLYEDAKSWYRRVLLASPDSPEALIALGDLHSDLGQWDEAETLYRQAIRVEPRLIRVLLKLAKLSLNKNDLESCMECCEKMLRILDLPADHVLHGLEDLSRLYLLIAHAQDKAGREDLFREAAEIALALHPTLLQEVRPS
jgi:tetratricopeptide (TPR) repeat protein